MAGIKPLIAAMADHPADSAEPRARGAGAMLLSEGTGTPQKPLTERAYIEYAFKLMLHRHRIDATSKKARLLTSRLLQLFDSTRPKAKGRPKGSRTKGNSRYETAELYIAVRRLMLQHDIGVAAACAALKNEDNRRAPKFGKSAEALRKEFERYLEYFSMEKDTPANVMRLLDELVFNSDRK
jgi:hypothetical protein